MIGSINLFRLVGNSSDALAKLARSLELEVSLQHLVVSVDEIKSYPVIVSIVFDTPAESLILAVGNPGPT